MSQHDSPLNDKWQPNRQTMSSHNSRNHECDSVLAMIPAFSIGATDPDEEEFIKGKLADCPEAVSELAKYMKLAEAMHYDASSIQASPGLAKTLQTAVNVSSAPPVESSRQRQSAKEREGAGVKAQPALYMRLGLVLLIGILVVLLASNIYWMLQVEQLRGQQDQVLTRLHDQDTALMLIGIGASNRIELPVVQTGIQPAPFAAIVVDPQGEYALLYVKHFPALQPDQAYQLWLEQGGQQTSAGLFSVDDDGLGILIFRTSMPIPSFDSVEITTEPAAGSSHPTTSPIARRTF